MDFIRNLNLPISPATAKMYLYVSLTILIAVILDNLLRSFIKVPKTFDTKRARTSIAIIRNIITFIIYAFAFQISLLELGINITPLLASAGIIGVILGIGARSIIEDLITGVFLLSQHNIALGDYVKIDDTEGTIESLGLRTLTIRGINGSLAIIPNGMVKKVINFSRHRASTIVNLPVKSDQKITTALEAANKALELLKKEKDLESTLYPGSKVNGIDSFKDPNVMIIQVTIVSSSAMRWEVGMRYRLLVKKEFEKEKILFG